MASALSGKGLSYLHVIEGDTGGTPVPPFDYKEIKRRFGGVVIANNGFDKARANQAIAEGRADLVAFGKPFISNPDLVTRLYLDAPLAPANRETFYGGADQGYTDYPLLARGRAACLLLRRRRAGLGVMGGVRRLRAAACEHADMSAKCQSCRR